jgi:hypothetical protein
MKRYEQGSVGMRADPEGSWCDYVEANAEIQRVTADYNDMRISRKRWMDEAKELRAKNEQLLAFAQKVLAVWPEGDLDGGALQDIAVATGLLVRREVTSIPCGSGCFCVDYYTDGEEIICYQRNKVLFGR